MGFYANIIVCLRLKKTVLINVNRLFGIKTEKSTDILIAKCKKRNMYKIGWKPKYSYYIYCSIIDGFDPHIL